tara:strand:- start:9597 stop:9986 length:390 start_codon:yes stop_codon:yes gene_type:complete
MAMSETISRMGVATPYLVVADGNAQVEFLEKAFDAEVVFGPKEMPGRKFGHCEVRVMNSIVMLGEPPEEKPFPGMVYIQVEDCDAAYEALIAAGATPLMPPADMDEGCRHGGVVDMNGNQWWVGTEPNG